MDKTHVIVSLIVRFVQLWYRYTFKGLVMPTVGLSIVCFVVQVVILLSVNELASISGNFQET